MANRILLNTERFAVSIPGQNVLTATPTNLIFDSKLGEFGGVFMTGTLTGSGQKIINFGRTLAKAPVIWCMARKAGTSTWYGLGSIYADGYGADGVNLEAGTTTTQARIYGEGCDLIRYVIFTIGAS